jgi:hypothetical protein
MDYNVFFATLKEEAKLGLRWNTICRAQMEGRKKN